MVNRQNMAISRLMTYKNGSHPGGHDPTIHAMKSDIFSYAIIISSHY
jgi:hypothetical protein